jgi:hypothetical protein
MKTKFFRRLSQGAVVAMLVCTAFAQNPVHFRGTINDYTPANVAGPWQVNGHWSLDLVGASGTANFSASLNMVRSDLGVVLNGNDLNSPAQRNAHAHHISVQGTVTPLANGFRVTGTAIVTANGNYPPPFGAPSTLQIDVIGGNTVKFSNIKLTFGGAAANHFGTQTVNGVVRSVN